MDDGDWVVQNNRVWGNAVMKKWWVKSRPCVMLEEKGSENDDERV